MTESDLFSTHGWTSQQVRILGFRLGMTWPEVQEQARSRRLSVLVAPDPDGMTPTPCAGQGSCKVCEGPYRCGGLDLDFGANHEVVEMSVTKVPDFAAKEVQRDALQRRFKGATRDFFEKYSKDLRLELLGPESSQESNSNGDLVYNYTYKYPELGMVIWNSPCPSALAESPCSLLELRFIAPGASR
jgi:hypothetical protein